jgi:1,2-diacylglycerol 3-alpha-glucosyltransferase
MKIVMLCDFYHESLEYQENLLAKFYTKHGHDVTVITSTFESVFDLYHDNYNNDAPARTYFDGKSKIVKMRNRFKVRFKLMNRLKIYTSIFGILEQERPDLIYLHDIISNILEVVKYKELNPDCKIILDYHADYTNSASNWLSLKILHGIIRKSILDRVRKHISKYFPITPESARFLNEVYSVPFSEMELLPLGADTDLGAEVRSLEKGRALRASFKIPVTDTIIFTGGKLSPLKKTELLLEAFKALPRENVHLFIIGTASAADKDYEAKLRNEAECLSNVHFTGWLNSQDIYSYLDMADIAVFPASQSILWQQAISMGLPLIVGDIGGQDVSYLNLYENMIILDRENIRSDKIFGAIQTLIDNPIRINEMRAGAERVRNELLNWDNLIWKTLKFNQNVTRPVENRQSEFCLGPR